MPGDISSAAPFLVLAALLPGSVLTVHDVGLNPLRSGILDVLERMGVRVGLFNKRRSAGELIGDVEIGAQPLVATRVEAAEVPRLVDELPLVALLGAFAHGTTEVRGAEELRPRRATASRRSPTRCARSACASRPRPDGFSVRGVPSRPARRDDRRAAATTASRCSARSPARSRVRACGSRAPNAWR